MESTKYIGMDVHKETVSIAVMNSAGKLVVESIIETKTATILQFIQGLRHSIILLIETVLEPNNRARDGKRNQNLN